MERQIIQQKHVIMERQRGHMWCDGYVHVFNDKSIVMWML